jgi:hypothetical protein
MKTILKLSFILSLLIIGLKVKSEIQPSSITLNKSTINLCLNTHDTLKVVNTEDFKRYKWQILSNSHWVFARVYDSILFPVDTLSYLLIPGDSTLNNQKVRCSAIDKDDNVVSSIEVPITIRNPILGQGIITSTMDSCCFGYVTAFYSVSGYSNVTSYHWKVPVWDTITYINETGDHITVKGLAPEAGGDTAISVTPLSDYCSPGNKSIKPLKVIGKISGVGVISGPAHLCIGNEATFVVSGYLNAVHYQWHVPSWVSITGSHSDSLITLLATGDGADSISVVPVNPCSQGAKASRMISVYSELTSGSIGPDTAICSHTSPGVISFTTLPTGSDGNYTYQWQESTDATNWTIIIPDTDTSYLPGNLDEDHYYQVIVSSGACSSSATTPQIRVRIFDRVDAGTIGLDQKICSNAQPDTLEIITSPSGGSEIYTYQWISSTDETTWDNINNATAPFYQPPLLDHSISYRLIVKSSGCGTDTTNKVRMSLSPSPLTASVSGYTDVCINQSDAEYKVTPVRPGYLYVWSLQHNLGTFQAGQHTSRTYIHWGNTNGMETLMLKQIVDSTQCENITYYEINIHSENAPDKTTIQRKPNSNILVCADSSENLKYQWGFIPKSSGVAEIIPNATLRYVILPHDFDTTATGYYYFVDTYYEHAGGVSCSTRSYLNQYALPISIQDPDPNLANIFVYPNPSDGIIHIKIPEGFKKDDLKLFLYDVTGRVCFNSSITADEPLTLSLPRGLRSGMYILKIISAKVAVFSTRLILNQ